MGEDPTQKLPASQNGMLEQILAAVRGLESRLEILEGKVEERLYDTRPIWEKVQADITQLQEGQQKLQEGQRQFHEGQESLRKDVREVRTELRDMNRKLSIFNDNLVQIQADYRDI